MNIDNLKEDFFKRFGKHAAYVFFCPGRVNIIGEHIDYNGGKVMPCAISLGTYLCVAENDDHLFRFECINFPETATLPIADAYTKTGKEWYNYPLGVIHYLAQTKKATHGLDMLFYGDLPIGAGLSSSASIEVLTGFAFNQLFQYGLTNKEIALLGKKAENEFIGVSSGIMDQFAVAMGKQEHAVLLNCDTLDYTYIPFKTDEYTLAIINSNKQRTLADSKYNERFAECRTALKELQLELPINHLCDLDTSEFLKHQHLIEKENVRKRAMHVITENERVRQACIAMDENDIEHLGKLIYESHDSLRDDYEVSGKELDCIVEFCHDFKGCIGARMTGAGFGGCAIALVKKERFTEFSNELIPFYTERIGYAPEVMASEIGDGVRKL